ncbi:MAG: hypothetical protein PF637_11080 [Spirochaetes bacterium]|jgi:hypothetical protein|nr:hypothetical protein [Spirochaetota bacterium]
MIRKLYSITINLTYSVMLIIIALNAKNLHIRSEYFILFIIILCVVLFPLIDYFKKNTPLLQRKKERTELYLDTIDSIIQLDSIDDLLSLQFNKLLSTISLSEGRMIFYDREKDEYTLYLKTLKPDSFSAIEKLDYNNILLEILDTPQDIIIKNRIGDALHFERRLLSEMTRLNTEIIVPMFFSDIMTGALLLGKRETPYSSDDLAALKIFASKVASLSMNAAFWKEMTRKIELEKDRKTELRVQRSFLPMANRIMPHAQAVIYFLMSSVLFDRFYNLFRYADSIYFISYTIIRDNRSTMIFLPSLAVLFETFIKSGMNIEQSIYEARQILIDKGMFETSPRLFVSSLNTEGSLFFINETKVSPFRYRGSLIKLTEPAQLEPDDLCIYMNHYTENLLFSNYERAKKILDANVSETAEKIKTELVNFLSEENRIKENLFFCLFKYTGVDINESE